jgi:Tfp pilus assembly protein FimT
VWVVNRMVVRKHNQQSGVSLLEILFTLFIITLASAIAGVNMPSIIRSFNRSAAVQSLTSDIVRARNEATKEGTRIVFSVAGDAKSYTVGYDYIPYSSPAAIDSGATSFKQVLPNQVTLSASQTIIFNSRGYLVDVNGQLTTTTVTLSYRGVSFKTATIYPTGHVVLS